MSVIAKGLIKRYGGREVVSSLDLRIEGGEIFALLGPNGAGKTTTVEMIEGFRRPDAGTIRVMGYDPFGQARELKTMMGLMLQEGGLYQQLRVTEVARLFASYYPQPQSPDGLIDDLGLRGVARRKVRGLSGGEKQRLNLLTALIGSPSVLVLDEPTAGMDPEMRGLTWERLTEMTSSGTTVLFTTHLTEEAERYADRVGVMVQGTIHAEGPPAELTSGMPLTFVCDRSLDLREFEHHSKIGLVELSPRRYRTSEPYAEELAARARAAVAAQGASIVEIKAGSLEDVMRTARGGDR